MKTSEEAALFINIIPGFVSKKNYGVTLYNYDNKFVKGVDMDGQNWFVDASQAYASRLYMKSEKQEQRLINIAKRGIRPHSPTQLIRMALHKHGEKLALLWSGGRCSTVVLHMALRIFPDIEVIFVDTGVEYPETLMYVNRLADEWGINLTVLRPKRRFWEIVREKGLPTPRKPHSNRKNGEPATPACCYFLKKKPVLKYVRRKGIEALITGMRAGESTVRTISLRLKRANFYFVARERLLKYHPIAFWSTRQVSNYAVKHRIPLNPLYLKTDRVGCWPCTAFYGWETQLARTNPQVLNMLARIFKGITISSCTENLPMHHLTFESAELGERVARLLQSRGWKIEIHDGGKIVCVPHGIEMNELKRVVEEARENNGG